MYALIALLFLWSIPVSSMDPSSTPVEKINIPPVPSIRFVVHDEAGSAREISYSNNKSVHESQFSPSSAERYALGTAESTSRVIKPPNNSQNSQSSPLSNRGKNRTAVPGIIILENSGIADENGQASSSRASNCTSRTQYTSRMTFAGVEQAHYLALLESLGNVVEMSAKSKFLNKQRADKQGVSVEQHLKDFLKKKAEENEHYEKIGEFKLLLPATIETIVKSFLTHQSPRSFSSKATPRNRNRTSKRPIFGLTPAAPAALPASADTKSEKEAKANNEAAVDQSKCECVIM